jgi:hypothetical protein
VNGVKAKLMVTAFISGKMEIGTKENGTIVLSMGKDLTFLQMAMFLLVLISMGSQKA